MTVTDCGTQDGSNVKDHFTGTKQQSRLLHRISTFSRISSSSYPCEVYNKIIIIKCLKHQYEDKLSSVVSLSYISFALLGCSLTSIKNMCIRKPNKKHKCAYNIHTVFEDCPILTSVQVRFLKYFPLWKRLTVWFIKKTKKTNHSFCNNAAAACQERETNRERGQDFIFV